MGGGEGRKGGSEVVGMRGCLWGGLGWGVGGWGGGYIALPPLGCLAPRSHICAVGATAAAALQHLQQRPHCAPPFCRVAAAGPADIIITKTWGDCSPSLFGSPLTFSGKDATKRCWQACAAHAGEAPSCTLPWQLASCQLGLLCDSAGAGCVQGQRLQPAQYDIAQGCGFTCTGTAGSPLSSHHLQPPCLCPSVQHLSVHQQRLVEVEADARNSH